MKPSLLIVALGNPGKQYEGTRHNVGWWAADVLSEAWGEGEWQDKPKFLSHVQEARLLTFPVLLVKPQTFMNRSGEAITKLVDFYKLDPTNQLIVLCDEIDLEPGDIRMKAKGGPGTHNGLKSIVNHLGEEFARARIGVATQPAGHDLAAWVLSSPAPDERDVIEKAINGLPEEIEAFVSQRESE